MCIPYTNVHANVLSRTACGKIVARRDGSLMPRSHGETRLGGGSSVLFYCTTAAVVFRPGQSDRLLNFC